jgi:hypothetical protein
MNWINKHGKTPSVLEYAMTLIIISAGRLLEIEMANELFFWRLLWVKSAIFKRRTQKIRFTACLQFSPPLAFRYQLQTTKSQWKRLTKKLVLLPFSILNVSRFLIMHAAILGLEICQFGRPIDKTRMCNLLFHYFMLRMNLKFRKRSCLQFRLRAANFWSEARL